MLALWNDTVFPAIRSMCEQFSDVPETPSIEQTSGFTILDSAWASKPLSAFAPHTYLAIANALVFVTCQHMRHLCVSVPPAARETIQEPGNLGLLMGSPLHCTQLYSGSWTGRRPKVLGARHRHNYDLGLKMGIDVALSGLDEFFSRCHCGFRPCSWIVLQNVTVAASSLTC